jgi:hypothetical protein
MVQMVSCQFLTMQVRLRLVLFLKLYISIISVVNYFLWPDWIVSKITTVHSTRKQD